MSSGPSIQNVSDTALWVAMYRASESERPDAHFHDPYARRLAGERGEAILRSLPGGRRTSWPMVVRTSVFDDVIQRYVRSEGVVAVLNLAAGLDARPWRLDLPPNLRWFDVDLPEILGYKQRELANEPPRCHYETRAVDLRDAAARRALFAEVGALGGRVLVVSEGLIIYLADEDVASLGRDLAAQPALRWWLFDLVAPELLARLNRQWGSTLARGNAPLRFAPRQGTRFFEPLGWKEREFHSTWSNAKRLDRRPPGAWAYDLMMRLSPPQRRAAIMRFAGYVLLESQTPERPA